MAAPTCLAPRHPVVALARRLEIPASDHVFEAALSFVDVDQVGDDSYERLSAHCEAVLKFVRAPRCTPRCRRPRPRRCAAVSGPCRTWCRCSPRWPPHGGGWQLLIFLPLATGLADYLGGR